MISHFFVISFLSWAERYQRAWERPWFIPVKSPFFLRMPEVMADILGSCWSSFQWLKGLQVQVKLQGRFWTTCGLQSLFDRGKFVPNCRKGLVQYLGNFCILWGTKLLAWPDIQTGIESKSKTVAKEYGSLAHALLVGHRTSFYGFFMPRRTPGGTRYYAIVRDSEMGKIVHPFKSHDLVPAFRPDRGVRCTIAEGDFFEPLKCWLTLILRNLWNCRLICRPRVIRISFHLPRRSLARHFRRFLCNSIKRTVKSIDPRANYRRLANSIRNDITDTVQ